MTTPAKFRRVKRGRWWSYELDGKRLQSVTRLLSAGVPKPNLIDWAARSAAEYAAGHIDEVARLEYAAAVDVIKNAPNRAKNTAAAKGTDIHRLGQSLAQGDTITVPEAITGYVDAYLAFLAEWEPAVVALEGAVVNRRWLYAGTFDALMNIVALGDDPVLIDTKTGGSGVWPETCLQVSAYRHGDSYIDEDGTEHPMPATAGGYALWLSDDGTYELLPVESGDDIFATFLHVCHVATFCGRAKDDLIGLPLAAPVEVAS